MNLEHAINWSIVNYPTLYRMGTHAESRLKVLGHYFLGIGTGMEWVKEGYLCDITNRHPEKMIIKQLPKNFYEMELFQVDIDPKMLKEAKQELKDNNVWFKVRKNYFGTTITFAWNKESIVPFVIKYECERDKQRRAEYAEISKDFDENIRTIRLREAHSKDHLFSPYPMCDLCPIAEMINKRTKSCHIPNFDLTFVKDDWIQGAIDVVKATLEYYADESRSSTNFYHPNQCLWQFKEMYDKDPAAFVEKRKPEGMTPETTIEDWCQICWERHVKEQIDYCNQFLEMYAS